MPAKEIKELRQAGKLDEALALANRELEQAKSSMNLPNGDNSNESTSIDLKWHKRNLSWVYYEYIKAGVESNDFQQIELYLNLLKDLDLSVGEEMLFDSCAWQIGKYIYMLCKEQEIDYSKIKYLEEIIQSFTFTKPSKPYTFLLKAFMNAYKNFADFTHFAYWWDLNKLMPEDFLSTEFNERKILSVAEQAYNLYSKILLVKRCIHSSGYYCHQNLESDVAHDFIDKLDKVVEEHPKYTYLPYFKVKLQLALHNETNLLPILLPFVRKTQGQFWAWGLLAEILESDQEKNFACLCRALICPAPPEMLTKTKERLVKILIAKKMYNEARTEIDQIIETKEKNGYKISNDLVNWTNEPWYQDTIPSASNKKLYKKYSGAAEEILFHDIPEEKVVVEFVNRNKEMLNFLSEDKVGFFKYGKHLDDVKIGDVLKVRFKEGSSDGRYQVNTVSRTEDPTFRSDYYKPFRGITKIKEGKSFGFVGDVFIHPKFVANLNLIDGSELAGYALKTFNKVKNEWGWKYIGD